MKLEAQRRILPQISQQKFRRAMSGIRPFRKGGIRLEKQMVGEKTIVHNYGHGGAGISLAPSTSREAVEIAMEGNFKGSVGILGSGINGLFCALECAKKGLKATVYADRIPNQILKKGQNLCTSEVAPGYWLPYHYDFNNKTQHMNRATSSFQEYKKLSQKSEAINWVEVYQDKTLQDMQKTCPQFIFQSIRKVQLIIGNRTYPMLKFKTLQINMVQLLKQLIRQCQNLGVIIKKKKFNSKQQLASLKEQKIINCLGLSSRQIFQDKNVYGIKGTLLQFQNNTQTTGIFGFKWKQENVKFYLFKNKCLLGLSREKSESLQINESVVKQLMKRAIQFQEINQCKIYPKL